MLFATLSRDPRSGAIDVATLTVAEGLIAISPCCVWAAASAIAATGCDDRPKKRKDPDRNEGEVFED
jgi:hypothetical protein